MKVKTFWNPLRRKPPTPSNVSTLEHASKKPSLKQPPPMTKPESPGSHSIEVSKKKTYPTKLELSTMKTVPTPDLSTKKPVPSPTH
jgi:hypothetical protein